MYWGFVRMAENDAQRQNPDAAGEKNCPDTPGRGCPLPVRVHSLIGLFLWGLVVIVVLRYFAAAQFMLLGLLGAAALAAALQPVCDRLPGPARFRAFATLAIFLVVIAAALGLLGWFLYEPIQQNIRQLPEIRQRANDGLQDFGRSLGVAGSLTVDELGEIAGRVLTGGSLAAWIPGFANSVLTALLAVAVVLIAAAYLLARPPGALLGPATKLLPPGRQEPTCKAAAELMPELRWWLIGTVFSMVLIAAVFGVGYWIIGLAFALPLALFAGITQVVPTFGPMVTLLLSLLIATTQGLTQVVGVFGVYLVVQSLESYFVTPMVMKRAVHIPPIVTLFTIILWGNIFGVAGLILAIPIDLTIWVLLKYHLVEAHERDARNKDGEPPRQKAG